MINTDESQYMYVVKGNNIFLFSSLKCALDVIYFDNIKYKLCIKSLLNINQCTDSPDVIKINIYNSNICLI